MWVWVFTTTFCCCSCCWCSCACCTRWAFCFLCFLSLFQTCSQKSSTLFRVGWLTKDRKSLYHSLWFGVEERSWAGALAVASSSRCSRSSRRLVSMTSKVTFKSVCMKPCSTAWHRYIPVSFLLSVRISRPWSVWMKRSSDLIYSEKIGSNRDRVKDTEIKIGKKWDSTFQNKLLKYHVSQNSNQLCLMAVLITQNLFLLNQLWH